VKVVNFFLYESYFYQPRAVLITKKNTWDAIKVMSNAEKLTSKASSKKTAQRKPPVRRPGRPASDSPSGVLDRETVLAVAFRLTKTVSVSELSIVRVARELGVTPALIHYYFEGGGRDALTSGVMNAFYREVIEGWPNETGEWEHDFEVVCESIYRAYLRYPGISIYAASHNRYQLVQDVQAGEIDYGLLVLEKFTGTVRSAGFEAKQTGVLSHLLMMFVAAYAHSTVTRRWPGQHTEFLSAKLSALDQKEFPNINFSREGLTTLNPTEAFLSGLKIVINGFGAEIPRPKK
jgi:AcrR family transcriptional regulator